MKSFVPLSKLPAAMARRLYISSRRYRDLESRFTRDVRRLRQRLAQGPHPRETPRRFYERLFDQAEMLLERYRGYFTQLRWDVPTRPGRPRSLDIEPRDSKGAPQKTLPAQVAMLAAEQRRPVPAVARDVFLADLRKRDPQRHQQFERARRDVQRDEDLSPEAALTRVFREPVFRDERNQLETLIRSSRNHVKRSRSVER